MQTINGIGTTIYGRAKRAELSGLDRAAAEREGFVPVSYQVIKWFVVLFVPVVPLGTYRVMKIQNSERFSMQPVEWDWGQVLRHFGIAYGLLIAGVLFLLYGDLVIELLS